MSEKKKTLREINEENLAKNTEVETGSEEEAAFGEFTQDSVGLNFVDQHIADLRYDHNERAWYRWTGAYWQKQETQLAFAYARDLVRELVYQSDATQAQRFTRLKVEFVAGVERYAQRDLRISVTHDYWDQDLFLLGTPGGTVDLRTGILHPARPEDGISKLTNATPSESADCPRWFQFLDEVTCGDKKLQHFLKVLNGYGLTGSVEEHLLAFHYGGGGNGKSKYLNTVSWLLGMYAKVAAMETFTASKYDRHPTDLAALCGARLITSSETQEGRYWHETRINQLTGGDQVTARFMRRDEFTYTPQGKLQIIGNHKPRIANITDGWRRRLALVPWLFKPTVIDTKLEEKLKAEGPGILRWMIEGCLEWQANGIVLPECVLAATKEYFNEEDLLARWIEERLERATTTNENASVLFADWVSFAEQANEQPRSQTWFGSEMKDRDFTKRTSNGLMVYEGVRLRTQEKTLRVRVLDEREDAYRVSLNGKTEWLPRSQVRLGLEGDDGLTEVTMPPWLARQKSFPF